MAIFGIHVNFRGSKPFSVLILASDPKKSQALATDQARGMLRRHRSQMRVAGVSDRTVNLCQVVFFLQNLAIIPY